MELKVVKAGAEKKYRVDGIRDRKNKHVAEAIKNLGGTGLEDHRCWESLGMPHDITFYSDKAITLDEIRREDRMIALEKAIDGLTARPHWWKRNK